ncbi:MAG: response regulator [Candidatus Levybacteria bacterium]|nr:response regulator [Candidatus Levybacteria bacterium]
MKTKILVADDDPAILDAIKMMLEFCDYDVDTIDDGAVIKILRQKKPKLLLLDIWMSGIDGRDICKKLKGLKETRDIPVILISASRDIERSSREAGANDFIAKPFEMNELLTKIEKYVPTN